MSPASEPALGRLGTEPALLRTRPDPEAPVLRPLLRSPDWELDLLIFPDWELSFLTSPD